MKCICRRQYIFIYTSLSSIRAYRHCVRGFEELFRHARGTLYPLADAGRTHREWSPAPSSRQCPPARPRTVSGSRVPYLTGDQRGIILAAARVGEVKVLYCEYPGGPDSMDWLLDGGIEAGGRTCRIRYGA